MKKKLFVLMLVLMLTLSVALAGCGTNETEEPAAGEQNDVQVEENVPSAENAPSEEEDTADEAETAPAEVTMFDGIYETRFTPEGYEEFVGYFHFYENGVVYVSLYNDQQYMAGYFEIVDEGVGWDPRLGVEDEVEFDPTQATTDKKIIITNFDGSEYAVVGYDSETDMVVNLESYYNKNFTHVLDSGHTDADETGVNVIEYYIEGDDYSMVALKHNGTFQDSVGAIIEGTWTKDGDVFTLTDGITGDSYTVSVNEDGTATYEALDGTTQILIPLSTAVVMISFAGTLEATYGEMAGTTSLFDDNTATIEISYAGTDNEFQGSWVLNEDYSLTLNFDGVEYQIPLDYETTLYGDFEYATSDGAGDVTLVMSQVIEEAPVVYTWVGTVNTDVILEMYSDGTCALIYVGQGTVTEGTWSVDTTEALPAWTIELDETFEDAPIEVTSDYATAFFFTFKNVGGQLEEELSLSFEDYQAVEQ